MALKPAGKLDRYVARLFAMSYLTAFLLVVGLYVIIDLSSNLDDLLEGKDGQGAPLVAIGRYYALHLPFLYLDMSPFVTLVAGLFTAARLVKANEIVAALGAGVSSRRLLAPVLVGAVALAAGMFALREWATERLGRERDELRARLLEQEEHVIYPNLWVRDASGRRLRVAEFLPDGPEGPEARGLIARFTEGDATVAIDAERMLAPVRTETGWRWRLEQGYRTIVDSAGKQSSELEVFDAVDVGPADFATAHRGHEAPLELSFAEATELHRRDPDNLQYRTVRQVHLTFPLAGLVLLLVGLPFLVGQERGRGVERVAAGVLLCTVYFAVDFVTRSLGLTGQIGPIYAAWFPLVLFGSLGLVLYASMRS